MTYVVHFTLTPPSNLCATLQHVHLLALGMCSSLFTCTASRSQQQVSEWCACYLESFLVCPVAEVLCGVHCIADSSTSDVGQQC